MESNFAQLLEENARLQKGMDFAIGAIQILRKIVPFLPKEFGPISQDELELYLGDMESMLHFFLQPGCLDKELPAGLNIMDNSLD